MSRRQRPAHEAQTDVRVSGDTVVKESVAGAALEFAKAAALHDVARARGFVAPRPISIGEDGTTVTFERVELGTPLYVVLDAAAAGDVGSARPVFERVGAVLGTIHAELEVDGAPVQPLPDAIARRLPARTRAALVAEATRAPVVGHGDFGTSNVFVPDAGDRDALVVLDSFANGYSSFAAAAHESRYLDLALFDSCLLGRGPVRSFLRARPSVMAALRAAVLDGYGSVTGVTVDARLLRAVSVGVLRSYFATRRNWPEPAAALVSRGAAARQWRHW